MYDVTIGYPDLIPQTELFLLAGKFPQQIHFHLRKYELASLPTTDDGLTEWCTKRWQEKEQLLREFQTQKKFPQVIPPKHVPNVSSRKLSCLLFWMTSLVLSSYLLYHYAVARWYVVLAMLAELLITIYCGGTDSIEKKMAKVKLN